MKKTIKIMSLIIALCLLLSISVACQPTTAPHACQSKCEICELCLNANCTEQACEQKCAGHTPTYDYDLQLLQIIDEVDLHTELQKKYLADDFDSISKYVGGTSEKSLPNALNLSWTATAAIDNASPIIGYTVQLSTDEQFKDNVWTYSVTENNVNVYNLMIASTYYWRVTAKLQNNSICQSSTNSFVTSANGPRNMFIDGITNVRDLGGWTTTDGSTVKQGLLIRCGRLNTSNQSGINIEITENGKYTMLEQLGVKTEIDLRMNNNNEVGGLTDTSPLGDSVQYVQCPMDYTVDNLITGNKQQLQVVFAILSDANNYPIIFHCNIGTDRTGVVAFLVNGLLGVPEETLYRDYLFSNFGNIGGSRAISSIKSNYVNYIKTFEGNDLSEKIYNCLRHNGVPSEHLDAVIDILK